MMYSIYKIVNLINGKIYIGQTSGSIENRFKKHIRASKHPKTYLHKAIKKYGENNFKIVLLEEVKTKTQANIKECLYIEETGSNNRNTGYNLTNGGEGCGGYTHTDQAKKKIQEQYKLRWESPVFRKKQAKNPRMLGKKHTDQAKKKIVETRTKNNSYVHTEETKEKISKSVSGRKPTNTGFWLITTPDNRKELIHSLTAYCKQVGIDHRLLHKVSQGICKHHKGYSCKKITEPKIYVLSTSSEVRTKDIPTDGIVFYNSEYQQKTDIILSIVKAKNNIYDRILYARNCDVFEMDNIDARALYEGNHIQGYTQAHIHLKLVHEGEDVGCMSFSRSRFNRVVEWELSRFVSLKGIRIMGGASKLFTHFIRAKNPSSVVTYADKRMFDGGVYSKMNFVVDGEVPPTYFYVHKSDPSTLLRKEGFRHNRMKDKLKFYDSQKSEFENMNFHGFHRIYDLGKIRFIWHSK